MSHGYSCISTIKALLTFEHQDLAYAIEFVVLSGCLHSIAACKLIHSCLSAS